MEFLFKCIVNGGINYETKTSLWKRNLFVLFCCIYLFSSQTEQITLRRWSVNTTSGYVQSYISCSNAYEDYFLFPEDAISIVSYT